jgi:hypothetical protein
MPCQLYDGSVEKTGHPAEIRAAEPRRQKHDRRDADLILKPLVETRFPAIWLRLTTPQDEQIFAARGVATITGGITLLLIEVRLSSASPGQYLLQLRKPTLLWNSYSLVVY